MAETNVLARKPRVKKILATRVAVELGGKPHFPGPPSRRIQPHVERFIQRDVPELYVFVDNLELALQTLRLPEDEL